MPACASAAQPYACRWTTGKVRLRTRRKRSLLDPDDPAAKAVLGVVMLELRRPADAIACLGEAVSIDPINPGYRLGLAAAQEVERRG